MGTRFDNVLSIPAETPRSPGPRSKECRYSNCSKGSALVTGWENWGVSVSPKSMEKMNSGSSPKLEHLKRYLYLKSFLRQHGFRDARTAKPGGCFFKRESLYPIHVAAERGDVKLVELLLAAGADAEKESSKGRTAMDFAKAADMCGSHQQVLLILEAAAKGRSYTG
ncbi:Receptor-likey region [Durusdinium trenchii]|uniref:Transmembrane domain-and RING domain-containing protein 6 n=1 Tax=Durusdinium trenchii TaxID=1381693 RepID=A0ABP0SEZ6_9DINO